jgi:hypothetical protein
METVKERESTAKKKKGGRPKKVIKKSVFLMVRLTVAELLMIQGKAREAGLKPSEWFRQAARKATITPRLSSEEMGWLRDLSGQTNNLNQLTKLAYQQGLIGLANVIRGMLDKTNLLMEKLMGDDR